MHEHPPCPKTNAFYLEKYGNKPYDLDVLNLTKYKGKMSRESCDKNQHSNFGVSGISGISGFGSWYIRHQGLPIVLAKVVSKVLPIVAQLAAWDRLVTQLDSHALVIDNGWSVHLEDLKGAAKNFSDLQSFIRSGWKRRGQKLLDSADKVLPDKCW